MSEKQIQRDVVEFYRQMGCVVCLYPQPRKTMQTPGIPDLEVFCTRKHATWRHEVKTPTGKQSAAQVEYQRLLEGCNGTYVLGGLDAATDQSDPTILSIWRGPLDGLGNQVVLGDRPVCNQSHAGTFSPSI